MQQIRMLTGRRGWFSDEAWWAAGQVLEAAEDVAAYLVDTVGAAEYVIAVQPEPLEAEALVALDAPPTALASSSPAVAGKGRRKPA